MRKIRMICMECNRVIEIPERTSDGRLCKCGGSLFMKGWADELDMERSGVSPGVCVKK